MRNACRPMGRFFCLLMVVAATLLPAPVQGQTSGPAMTQVVDIVYRADGTAARGTVLISWPAFTTADGKAVAAGSSNVLLGTGGAFAASLAPNTGAQPAGVYYKVVFQLTGQEPSTEYWVVPATGSTSIGAVRAKLMPATAAAQVLTRDLADTNYVHVVGDQAVSGAKSFATLTASAFQGIQYVCQQSGTDIGAKFQAAYNNLPLDSDGFHNGTVSFDGCSGYQSWTTRVVMTSARVKVVGNNATYRKAYFQCNTSNCITLQQASNASSSDGANGSIFQGFDMEGNGTLSNQCGITISDVYNVALRDLYFAGFSANGSAPVCIQSVIANSTGVEGLVVDHVMFNGNYYGANYSNVSNTANGASFGYETWTGVRCFGGVTGGACVNMNSGILYHSFIQLDPNTNAANFSAIRLRGTQYNSGPGTSLWYDRLQISGECGGTCTSSYVFDLSAGTTATVWLDWHTSTSSALGLQTGSGILTPLVGGANDGQTISYVGHKPLCSGNPEQSNIGGNYQACILPYANTGSYESGLSFNMTYDRAGAQYPCLGDGTSNGCSALLGQNSGDLRFVGVGSNGGATRNIAASNLLNYTIMRIAPDGVYFYDGSTQTQKAKIDTAGNATVQNLTVNGTCTGCGAGSGNLASPPAIGSTTPNTGAFTSLTAQSVDGTLNAAAFPGADPCAQINNAVAVLPSAGGTVDATSFQGTKSCTTAVVLSKPLQLKLGGVVLQVPQIKISAAGVKISGVSQQTFAGYVGTAATTIQSNAAQALIYVTGGGSYIVEDLNLDGNGKQGLMGVFDPQWSNGTVRNVKATNFANSGIYMRGGLNKIHDLVTAHNGGDGVVFGSDGVIDGLNEFAYSGETIAGKGGLHVCSGGTHVGYVLADFNSGYGVMFDGVPDPDWQSSHTYQIGDEIQPGAGNTGSYIYIATTTGTSGASAPTWTQGVGATVADGSVTWTATHVLKATASGSALVNGIVSYNTGPGLLVQGDPTHLYMGVQIGTVLANTYSNTTTASTGVSLVQTWLTTIGDLTCYGSAWSGGPNNDSGCLVINGGLNTTVDSINSYNTHKSAVQVNGTYTSIGKLLIQNNADGQTTGTDRYAVTIATGSSYTTIGQAQIFDRWRDSGGPYSAGIYNWGAYTKIANLEEGTLISGANLPNDWELAMADWVDVANAQATWNFRTQTNYVWDGGTGWGNNRSAIDQGGVHAPAFCTLAGSLTDTSECIGDDGNGNMRISSGASGITFANNAHSTVFGSVNNASGLFTWGGDLSVRDIPGHAYFVSKYASIQAAINAAYGTGAVAGKVIDDRTAAYSGAGFYVPDSVTVELAPVPYTFTGTVTHNNGNNNVTAAIVVEQGGHVTGRSTSSNHGTVIGVSPGFAGDIVATTSEGTGIGTAAQWWHWGSIENLNINGTGQASGRCLVVENMGETARLENIEARSCFGNNIEIIGASATQSSVRNITTMRSQTASGIRFTNLAGVGKIDGLSGDCNPTALVSVQENAAGSLTILGLKAEGEASICTGTVQDPVVLLDGVAGFNDHVRIIGGYAFGTAQANFAKFINAGNAILETEGLYITGYTNMLNDTVRAVTVPLTASSSKQPFYYEPGGTTFANQAFTLTGGTFIQGAPAGTPTEIFGLTTGSATLLAAAGNGDNSSILAGGIQISGQNRTSYGTPPEIMARWGYRWLGAGLGYDTTNFDLVPAWNSGDSSTRNLGNPLTVCQKGSTTVSCRWPNIYAQNVDT
ncbi:MAG: hypothetical protein WBS19_10785, partial [Candidatus Korobacteraceae bacterium]